MRTDLTQAEEYAGPAVLTVGDTQLDVEVTLRSVFQPIDGRLHWYGRIATNTPLAQQHNPGGAVSLTTPDGSAVGKINDVDLWGRFRITGVGKAPF